MINFGEEVLFNVVVELVSVSFPGEPNMPSCCEGNNFSEFRFDWGTAHCFLSVSSLSICIPARATAIQASSTIGGMKQLG